MLALVAVLYAGTGCGAGKSVPENMADAIASIPELAGSKPLIPPDNATWLGHVNSEDSKPSTASHVPCFFVSAIERNSVKELSATYASSSQVMAELSYAAVKAGAKVEGADTATVLLQDLKIRSAVGVPNSASPCFKKPGEHKLNVLTKEVVAGAMVLDFGEHIKGDVSVAMSAGVAGVGVGSGWAWDRGTKVKGNNIVIGGWWTPITATVLVKETNLGGEPVPGAGLPVPDNTPANVTIVKYNEKKPTLVVRVSATLGAAQQPPPGLVTKPIGENVELIPGEYADFWLAPGSSLISVSWNLSSDGGSVLAQVTLRRSDFPDFSSAQ